MKSIELVLPQQGEEYLAQVRYALSFASEDVREYEVTADGVVRVQVDDQAAEADVREKVERLLERYARAEYGMRTSVHFRQERACEKRDAWSELVESRWITPVGVGHVIVRGPGAELMQMIDAKALAEVGRPFEAEPEVYPATIQCRTLDRCNHFTSFPEHIDFVAHMRGDLDVLERFVTGVREGGFSPDLVGPGLDAADFAICPSCCYHCYEGMENWEVAAPGRCVTTILGCHRYEGKNLESLARLRAFTMREIVWIGKPDWVKAARARSEEIMVEWAKKWELDCALETANDLFFTDDFAVKASFQRQQEAKKELRLTIPQEERTISVFSSNFHSVTFGKEFGIRCDGRPCVTACTGWGLERWLYGICSQFGLAEKDWPAGLREDLDRYRRREL